MGFVYSAGGNPPRWREASVSVKRISRKVWERGWGEAPGPTSSTRSLGKGLTRSKKNIVSFAGSFQTRKGRVLVEENIEEKSGTLVGYKTRGSNSTYSDDQAGYPKSENPIKQRRGPLRSRSNLEH